MYKRLIVGAMAFVVSGAAAARAQDLPRTHPDDEAIRKSVDDYCAAFNNGKIDVLLSYWSDDADYVDGDGQAYRGKDAIGAVFQRSLEALKDSKLKLKIENLRFVKPDVAIEDGVASLTGPEGGTSDIRYTAIWAKDGDRWRISSAHDLSVTERAAPAANADYLKELDWLIGDWTSDDNGRKVNLTSKWALDKNYIVQDYVVAGEASDDLRVTQWIGFDPLTGQIKSWTFDSLGGYGEGLWQREDNTWSSESAGVLPDGRVGSALNSVRFIDNTHMEWRSTGRNVEGQPMSDAKVSFVRAETAARDSQR